MNFTIRLSILACLTKPTKYVSNILWKTLMINCMQKIKVIPHLVHKMLHFKESYNLIGLEY